MHAQDLVVPLRRQAFDGGVEGDEGGIAAAPLGLAGAHMVDHDRVHHPRGVGKKVLAVGEVRALSGRKAQPGFMNQVGRVQAQLTRAGQARAGDAPKVGIKKCHHPIGGLGVAGMGRMEQLGDLGCHGRQL